MQGFDHRLVTIHQAELQAEARRERIAGVVSFRVPVQPVQPVEPVGPETHGTTGRLFFALSGAAAALLASATTVLAGHR
jgi:hypothetical protein